MKAKRISGQFTKRCSALFPYGRITLAAVALILFGCNPLRGAGQAGESRWVHPLCKSLPITCDGPFVELEDGSLMTVDDGGVRESKDNGRTWSEKRPVHDGIDGLQEGLAPATASVLRTTNGALVIVYLDATTFNFSWNNETNQPRDGCRLEVWAIRSLDGGKTWIDRQRILEGYNPNFFGFIQIDSGRLVACVPHLVRDPGRYVACSLTSDDDGKTWKRSNLIDLGGHGDHSGAMEPTVAQLSNARLLMMIRTHWGRFWEAYSEDGGLSWRTVLPGSLASSSAPGYLLRLGSGRLALVSNGKKGRRELLLRFSEDDAKTWSGEVVIVRQNVGEISYPYFWERRPGELWITVGRASKTGGLRNPWPVRLQVNEDEFLQAAHSQ